MKRIIIVSMFFLIFTSFMSLNAQWARTYGDIEKDDVARSVQQTNDGGYIVVGYTSSFGISADFWILKLNSYGEIEWEKNYGGADEDVAYCVQQTTDNGYIIAGYNALDGSYDPCVLKLDSLGNIEWQKKYKQTEWAFDVPTSVQQTSDGGYVVFGWSFANAWILKLDSLGDIEWQKSYNEGHFYSAQQTSDGGYIVGGRADFGDGESDPWILKLDSLGDIEWQKRHGEAGGREKISSIQQTTDGGYIVGAWTMDGVDRADLWILKLDSFGSVEWQRMYNGADESTSSVQQTTDGGYIVLGRIIFGSSNQDLWILKLDSFGDIEWQRRYGGTSGEDVAYSIQQTTDEGYIVAGYTDSFGSGEDDVLLLKLFPNGDIHSSCGFIGTLNATIADTFVILQDVSEVFQDGNFVASTLTDPIQDSSAIVTLICECPTYSLTISAGSGGTTDPSPGTYTYYEVTEVEVTAIPNSGYRFSGWDGDASGITNPVTITMDSDKSITANFIRQYTLTTRTRIGGTILPEPGIHTYDEGTRVVVEAIPESGWRWNGWAGDWAGDTVPHENPTTIVMNADKLIEPNFIREYTLTIAAGIGGTTNPIPGTHTYRSGIEVLITATAETGYRFVNWSGDASDTENSIVIRMDSDKSITANFIHHQYILTIATSTGGTTNPSPGAYTHDSGAQVSVQAVPNSGYQFNNWSGDASGTTNPITITMDSDKSITANFIRPYILTIDAGTGGTTNPSPGSYDYDPGTQVSVTAIPNSGYEFGNWSGDASGTVTTITINMDSDKSITASFTAISNGDGDGGGDGKKGGCFIATAAYGSPLHPHLDILRDFRDKYLMPSKLGSKLVDLYYKYSPFFADLIANHKALKAMVRFNLLPIIAFSYSMLYFGPVITAVILIFIFIFSIFLILFFRRKMRQVETKSPKAMASLD